MDGERTVESNGSRHTMPDEIMDMSAPLHCLERNIAQRVHSEVQREIREHDQTGCEAEPPDRHLIAKNIRIEHLKSGPPGLETPHRTKGIRVLQGDVGPPMSALGHKRTFGPRNPMSASPPKADIWIHRGVAARSGICRVKLTPIGVGSRVSSPPSCFESAVTKRVASRLLAVGSKLGGRPTPSSRTEIATDSFSVSTCTQIEPPARFG